MEAKPGPSMEKTMQNEVTSSVNPGSDTVCTACTEGTKTGSADRQVMKCSPSEATQASLAEPASSSTTALAVDKDKGIGSDDGKVPVRLAAQMTHTSEVSDPTKDDGSHQVTVDRPHQSLLQKGVPSLAQPERIVPFPSGVILANNPTQKVAIDVVEIPNRESANLQSNSTPDEPAVDETIQRLRAPLVETYAPFIHPTDTCLADARDRLKAALNQTRVLRAAFSDRVYKKYRVLLRPVPKSIDIIVDRIVADPKSMNLKLQEDIRTIKDEKDIEKKETQKLMAAKPASGPDGTLMPSLSTAETVEQLAFFGAGLSLVILPEEDVDEDEIDLREYEHRGPINPETGHRVGGISAAAAAAAEVLLDRVRRGGVLRMERQRRQQVQLVSGELPEGEVECSNNSNALSTLQIFSNGATARPDPDRVAPVSTVPALKRPSAVKIASPPFVSPSSGVKSGRVRSNPIMSGSALLSLNPNSEELRTDGKPSAATAALISRGAGMITARSVQQRWRHPHPESLGGRRSILASTSPSGKKTEYSPSSFASPIAPLTNMPGYLALPPLPIGRDRRDPKPFPVVDDDKLQNERARKAVLSIIKQFKSDADINDTTKQLECITPHPNGSDGSQHNDSGSSCCDTPCDKTTPKGSDGTIDASSSHDVPTKRIRRATEIGLLRGLQYSVEHEQKAVDSTVGRLNMTPGFEPVSTLDNQIVNTIGKTTSEARSMDSPIEPILAFSVLHALGLVGETKQDEPVSNPLARINPSVFDGCRESKTHEAGSTRLKDNVSQSKLKRMFQQVFSRKRLFSDAFPTNDLPNASCDDMIALDEDDGQAVCVSEPKENEWVVDPEMSLVQVNECDTKNVSIVNRDTRNEKASHAAMEECPVVAIRGGGEMCVEGSDDDVVALENVKAAEKEAAGLQLSTNVSQSSTPSVVNEAAGHRETAEKIRIHSSMSTASKALNQERSSSNPPIQMEASLNVQRPSSATLHETTIQSQSTSWSDQSLSLLSSRLHGNGSDTIYAVMSRNQTSTSSSNSPMYSSPRTTSSNNFEAAAARMHGQHQLAGNSSHHHPLSSSRERFHRASPAHALHLHHAASVNRLPSPAHRNSGDLSDYFSLQHVAQRSGAFGSRPEWSSIGVASAAAVGLLPTHSSLAAMGLDPHHAAMVSYSVRDRAARALLVREHQQNAAVAAHAVAAHRHASAVIRSGASVTGLSPQQAAVFMGTQVSHGSQGMYAQSAGTAGMFSPLGTHPTASTQVILSTLPNPNLGSTSVASVSSAIPSQTKTSQNELGTTKEIRTLSSMGHSEVKYEILDSNGIDNNAVVNTSLRIPKSSDEPSNPKKRKNIDKPSQPAATATSPMKEVRLNREVPIDLQVSTCTSDIIEAKDDEKGSRSLPSARSEVSQSTDSRSQCDVHAAKVQADQPTGLDSVVEACRLAGGHLPSETSENAMLSSPPSHKKISCQPASIQATLEENAAIPTETPGMQFFVPPTPLSIPSDLANFVLEARFHEALAALITKQGKELNEGSRLLDFLVSVGAAVPIPKALVSNLLKERLNTTWFRNPGGNTVPSVPRDVIIAAILIWLWVQHRDSFQRAFAKSGRIDVDPDCKWLIQAAVDAAVRAMMLEITDATAKSGATSSRNRVTAPSSKAGSQAAGNDGDLQLVSSTSVELHIASIVSRALMTEFCIDCEMDTLLPHYERLVQIVDECRLCSLRGKCRERALLGALISRRATMSEPFSHAYVSAMVRAGEAIGHDELFDLVQDEDTMSSTMIPYDIFTDETGAWEDPCRPPCGFTQHLTGGDLIRLAHARAIIQKSLKKLQDRHNIRGGVHHPGPYSDPTPSGANPICSTVADSKPNHGPAQLHRTPSGPLKRKSSFSALSDGNLATGIGSAFTANLALFSPSHYCTPLHWDLEDASNMPYGAHAKGTRPRSFSVNRLSFSGSFENGENDERGSKKFRPTVSTPPKANDLKSDTGEVFKSTLEIDWIDVATIFQSVDLPNPATPSSKREKDDHALAAGTTIIAPFCRKVGIPPKLGDDDVADDEDLSEEAILARHQVVLDRMKQKVDQVIESRQQVPQRARSVTQ